MIDKRLLVGSGIALIAFVMITVSVIFLGTANLAGSDSPYVYDDDPCTYSTAVIDGERFTTIEDMKTVMKNNPDEFSQTLENLDKFEFQTNEKGFVEWKYNECR